MRVLFVTQFFWPEARTAPTNLAALAEDLAAKGHEVMVVTGVPNHPLGRVYDGYKMKLWQWESARGFKILRLPLFPDHSKSTKRRLLNYSSYALSASTLGIWLSRHFQPDILFSYYAPLTMGSTAALFKHLRKAPLVYWITDIWPENFRASGVQMSARAYGWLRRFEDWGYDQANAICVDSPGYRINLLGKGVPDEKIHIVAEWADERLFSPVERLEQLGRDYGLAGRFNIVYGGNLGQIQRLDIAIEAARRFSDTDDVQFVFIGDGNAEQQLKNMVEEYNLPNVRFIPRQPMDKMQYFFAWADALLVHLKKEPIFELQLPSKVLAYMACGRPILNGVSGTVEQIVSQAGCGLSCPPEDPEAMAQLVRRFLAMPQTEREHMGHQGRQTYLANYSRSVQVQRLENIFQEVMASQTT